MCVLSFDKNAGSFFAYLISVRNDCVAAMKPCVFYAQVSSLAHFFLLVTFFHIYGTVFQENPSLYIPGLREKVRGEEAG